MSLRTQRLPAVVDARDFCDPDGEARVAPGAVPSVFEFARTCGKPGRLSGGPDRAANVRVVAILYLGGGLFEGPGAPRARFGVLLRARRRLPQALYALEVTGATFAPLVAVPVRQVPHARVRDLSANHYFLVR